MVRGLAIRLVTLVSLLGIAAPTSAQVLSVNGVVAPNTLLVAGSTSASVGVTNGPGNARDWVALYPVGSFSLIDWFYLNGSKTAPGTGVTSATLTFTIP